MLARMRKDIARLLRTKRALRRKYRAARRDGLTPMQALQFAQDHGGDAETLRASRANRRAKSADAFNVWLQARGRRVYDNEGRVKRCA